MISSLFRPKTRHNTKGDRRPLLFDRSEGGPSSQHADSSAAESDFDDEDGCAGQYAVGEDEEHHPLLPIFSAARLDQIPVYHLQHSIRLLVVQKCETTLSWDQLRSPQISQFLVKPLQQQIRTSHTSSATLYALLANCLQFQKDCHLNPGLVGVSRTRAFICELLAMRLLRESSTRELIDALFYDFNPLQGLPVRANTATPIAIHAKAAARISTVEIAIRAHAKRFLAHPLVVQQLAAVWAGNIVFHSGADNLHRLPSKEAAGPVRKYGAVGAPKTPIRPGQNRKTQPGKGKEPAVSYDTNVRRSVTLYDPSHASLFKLSRLRVPRYRQHFSTLSYAIMLGLFLAVLVERSLHISGLELIFWFWGAGYMLDEVVGFSEQGFGLYVMSFWNIFDMGILLLFILYYVLRLYGIIMPDVEKKYVANMAYDVLASTAVLLFPRLFSVLDHYRYFSQLLIAFRMMAVDLAAVLILIVISCSGFFVAFTLSFSDEDFNAASAAYALFQIVMGFTPAAWEIWADFSILGRVLLGIFLIICHFLIVTILITVLTNSFMAIVQNANEEHQFLFAVNTISMVKSDALFSYIPPTNILSWCLSPLRFVIPFRTFVRVNRTVIKTTHIPILFTIFVYERLILYRRVYEPTDLVEQRGRRQSTFPAFTFRPPTDLFSPGMRLREPSLVTFHKDRALEEVFRRPLQSTRPGREGDLRKESGLERTKSTNIVQDWMRGVGLEGGAATPVDQPRSVVEELEVPRPGLRRHKTTLEAPQSSMFSRVRSAASDPEGPERGVYAISEDSESPAMSMTGIHQPTDADGDDELATEDDIDDERETADRSCEVADDQGTNSRKEKRHTSSISGPSSEHRRLLAQTDKSAIERDGNPIPITFTSKRRRPSGQGSPITPNKPPQSPSEGPTTQERVPPAKRGRGKHIRTTSSATILFAPLESAEKKAPFPPKFPARSKPTRTSGRNSHAPSGTATPHLNRSHTDAGPSTSLAAANRDQEDSFGKFPAQTHVRSTPNLASFLALNRRKPSFNTVALDLASDLGDNRIVHDAGMLSGSWGTQLDMAHVRQRRQVRPMNPLLGSPTFAVNEDEDDEDAYGDGIFGRGAAGSDDNRGGDTRRLNRLMLSRMMNLEETFKEVLREVKGISRSREATSVGGDSEAAGIDRSRKRAKQKAADDGLGGEGRSSV